MGTYDFPPPLDYGDEGFLEIMDSDYSRRIGEIAARVRHKWPLINPPIHEGLDRESLAQMVDLVAAEAGRDLHLQSLGHTRKDAERALIRRIILEMLIQ